MTNVICNHIHGCVYLVFASLSQRKWCTIHIRWRHRLQKGRRVCICHEGDHMRIYTEFNVVCNRSFLNIKVKYSMDWRTYLCWTHCLVKGSYSMRNLEKLNVKLTQTRYMLSFFIRSKRALQVHTSRRAEFKPRLCPTYIQHSYYFVRCK